MCGGQLQSIECTEHASRLSPLRRQQLLLLTVREKRRQHTPSASLRPEGTRKGGRPWTLCLVQRGSWVGHYAFCSAFCRQIQLVQ